MFDRLAPSEQEVAELAAQGLSNRQIAERLCKAMTTVKSQLAAAYQKLGVNSRFGLIAFVLAKTQLEQAREVVAALPLEVRTKLSLLSAQGTAPMAISQIARDIRMQPREILAALDALWKLRMEELRDSPQLQTCGLLQPE